MEITRREYLTELALESSAPVDVVFALADFLGENEDKDGLVAAIDDYLMIC